MGLFKAIGKLILLVAAASAGAAAGDLVRQRVTGEEGRVVKQTPEGGWSVKIPPQLLIPAVLAGFRDKERGLFRAAMTAAVMSATGGQPLGGIAGRFFGQGKQ